MNKEREALHRILNSALNRPGDRPRICIPAQADDDDLVLADACDELPKLRAVVAAARAHLRTDWDKNHVGSLALHDALVDLDRTTLPIGGGE